MLVDVLGDVLTAALVFVELEGQVANNGPDLVTLAVRHITSAHDERVLVASGKTDGLDGDDVVLKDDVAERNIALSVVLNGVLLLVDEGEDGVGADGHHLVEGEDDVGGGGNGLVDGGIDADEGRTLGVGGGHVGEGAAGKAVASGGADGALAEGDHNLGV